MEKTHSVAISVYKHFTEIQGMMKGNMELAITEILKYLGSHAICTEYTTSAQVHLNVNVLKMLVLYYIRESDSGVKNSHLV